VGRLALHVDVEGAEAQVDGHPLDLRAQPFELAVGTHALRVTHPAYHDFLRFVDIEFDRTVTLEATLAAYPRAEGQMAERRARQQSGPTAPGRTWRWWVLGAAGVALTAVTAGIVWAVRPGIEADRTLSYRALPQP
jgi:hypothetical protein